MADKNNMADENYLDNLLKAITGEGGEDTSDKINEDELSFDSDVKNDGAEDDFLSDFEKEFFDEDESKLLDDMFGKEVKKGQDLDKVADEMIFGLDDNTMVEESDTSVADEEDKTPLFVNENQNMGDSSVEEDLQGLYGILGVDNVAEGMSEGAKEQPKKKGLFSRMKKEKEPKKPKEKKAKKEKKEKKPADIVEAEVSNVTANEAFDDVSAEALGGATENVDPALEGFDVEALFNNADGGFDMSEGFSLDDAETISFGTDENGGLTFGLDDSSFGASNESENDMLIRQMDEGELDDDELLADESEENSKKSKKSKKEKKSKEKKSKDKGDKKEKKVKAKKPKKEKEPKVKRPPMPDEIINIPVIAVVFMLSFIIVAVVAAKMGGDYYFYQERIYDAVELYVDTDQTDIEAYESRYSEAYRMLSGMEMRNKEHQVFYDQVQTIMFMDRHYEAYKGYMLLENFDNGLDSLIKAVKMYDKYQNKARELGCFDDMTVILSWVSNKLNDVYGITESRARELSMITDDREYAVIVREIAGKAEAKYLESKTEEELK